MQGGFAALSERWTSDALESNAERMVDGSCLQKLAIYQRFSFSKEQRSSGYSENVTILCLLEFKNLRN